MIFHSLVLAAGSIVAAAASVSCDDGSIDDIYRGDSSGEYVSETDWTEAADLSTETYIKYFFENAGGGDTFGGSIWWEKPNTPQTGEPSSADGSGGWSQGHALDIVTDYYIRHSDDPELQKKIYDEIMVPFLPAFDDWNRTCGYGGNDFWNNFYDDMEWMALACLRVYELTGDEDYYDALMKGIFEKLVPLDGDIAVIPGHGPHTSITDERTKNPFLLPFNEPYEDEDDE